MNDKMSVEIPSWTFDRKDWYEIMDTAIKRDAECVALILMKNGVINNGNGYSTLKTKNYGTLFNLCECEPFRDQPVVTVPFFTGFLIKDDVIATAGHCVNGKNVSLLRIVFGFRIVGPFVSITAIPNENIYSGIKIIGIGDKSNGSDWALIKLDRKVKDKMMATLSRSEIYCNKSIHVLGHPVGLPLKYASGETVSDNSDKSYFTANLNIYSGNSGSPVFNSDKHEVIGLVVRGYDQYFSLEKDCWVSIDHANLFSHGGVHCTKVSEFIDFIGKL